MIRHGSSSNRQLTLTEELEKLEQSITLTLQEIDHNFSRTHRIVTTSILPIVEQYAEHSKAVWEGSKFWKQFFEASANVSLSGYEEAVPEEEDEEEETGYSQSQENTYAAEHEDHTSQTDGGLSSAYNENGDDSLLEDTDDMSGSTPRPPQMQSAIKPKFASYDSPYESLKYELKGGKTRTEEEEDDDISFAPETPGRRQTLPDMSMTPLSSPFEPTTNLTSTRDAARKPVDPLLHRILDKNYRLQATPHSTLKPLQRSKNETPSKKPAWQDDSSPMSSPPSMAPQLRSEIFSSPVQRSQQHKAPAPRTPGVSVQTPAKTKNYGYGKTDEITWESDSDDADNIYKELGISPPKTIQFNLGPNRLLRTPAREASKMIVDELLATAGAGGPESDLEEMDSPSVIRSSNNLDDSF